MANQFKKDKIDFDVYERQDPDSQVNWAKAAQDITKTFEGIRDERQGRKDKLEAMITEQQNALNDIGSYDSPTLQQVALDASNDSANKLMKCKSLKQTNLLVGLNLKRMLRFGILNIMIIQSVLQMELILK